MKIRYFEARTAGVERGNHGKFLVGVLERSDMEHRSTFPGFEWVRLLPHSGMGGRHVLVVDLATGEGSFFAHGGLARHDLRKHRIWVCVLYEGFLEWVYAQNMNEFDTWPAMVDVEAPFSMQGYRRGGPTSCGMCGADPTHWRTLNRE